MSDHGIDKIYALWDNMNERIISVSALIKDKKFRKYYDKKKNAKNLRDWVIKKNLFKEDEVSVMEFILIPTAKYQEDKHK